jgi:2-isopropylmalate synthase
VQRAADASGAEVTAKELWELFEQAYLAPADGPLTVTDWHTAQTAPGAHDFRGVLRRDGRPPVDLHAAGNGPLSALTAALAGAGIAVDILDYAEHATGSGPDSPAVAYARCRTGDAVTWGAGRDTSLLTASVRAVLAAVNRGAGERSQGR